MRHPAGNNPFDLVVEIVASSLQFPDALLNVTTAEFQNLFQKSKDRSESRFCADDLSRPQILHPLQSSLRVSTELEDGLVALVIPPKPADIVPAPLFKVGAGFIGKRQRCGRMNLSFEVRLQLGSELIGRDGQAVLCFEGGIQKSQHFCGIAAAQQSQGGGRIQAEAEFCKFHRREIAGFRLGRPAFMQNR